TPTALPSPEKTPLQQTLLQTKKEIIKEPMLPFTHRSVNPLQAPFQPLDVDDVGAATSTDTPPYGSSHLATYPNCDGEATIIEAFLGNLEAEDSAADKDLTVIDNHAALDATPPDERATGKTAATPANEDIVAKVPLTNNKDDAKGSQPCIITFWRCPLCMHPSCKHYRCPLS
ncbi:hypothetical protein L7F22_014662, partial [Adiantum nelumboides]|nr:hypothetical protein [Adiantum nelumboides]